MTERELEICIRTLMENQALIMDALARLMRDPTTLDRLAAYSSYTRMRVRKLEKAAKQRKEAPKAPTVVVSPYENFQSEGLRLAKEEGSRRVSSTASVRGRKTA